MAFNDKEFAAYAVCFNLKTRLETLAWVETMRKSLKDRPKEFPIGERMVIVGMEAYVYKNQADLDRRLAFAWEVVDAPKVLHKLRQSAWEVVVDAAENKDCVCGGRWIALTEELLEIQVRSHPASVPFDEAPHSSVVREALEQALRQGCAKHTNVFFYGPKDAGKSHVLKPLIELFGDDAFTRPVGTGNYPLADIFGKKVVVLQDVRMNTYKLSFDSLLVWWEGEAFRVPLAQNHHKGDRLYKDRAPLFASSGGKLRIPLEEAVRMQVNPERQNDMMDARWRYFHHSVSMPPDPQKNVAPCARCFSRWLLLGPMHGDSALTFL